MALEQKLSLKLSQKLVMTPSLQQAIKLLQMTRLELDGVLNQELEENPVLEEGVLDEDSTESEGEEASEDEPSMDDIDLDAFFSEYAESWEGSTTASVYEERQGPPLENSLATEDDLYDQLKWQLQMSDASPLQREIAELIIGNLDREGFLKATVREIMALGIQDEAFEEGAETNKSAAGDSSTSEARGEAGARLSEGAEWAVAARPGTQAIPAESPAMGLGLESGAASSSAADLQEKGAGEADSSIPADAEKAADLVLEAVWEALEAAGGEEANGEEEPDPVGGYSRQEVEDALALVRAFDPPGVASRDLRECLLLQMERQEVERDSLAYRMISEHWSLFKHRKFEPIAKALGVPLMSLEPAVAVIKGLEIRPGRLFNNERARYVEPDVNIVKVGEEYVVQLNDDGMPRLRVSKQYRRMLLQMKRDSSQVDARQYIKEKMRSALWLIKSLDQRQRTIYKVAQSIVQQQRAFLDFGIDHLRPMVLRDVAEDIEMHESTVSRVVSNKYMNTPRGVYAMKFFFHSGIDRDYGGDISSLTVKKKIKHMIQDEDPKKPLSDSELMRRLNKDGIHIARRTVAKYRDELNIPSSTDRKKIF